MGRYIKAMRVKNADNIYNVINDYLVSERYKVKIINGEKVYQRGSGMFIEPTFFKFDLQDDVLTMQTWTTFYLFDDFGLGEFGLDCPWYILKDKNWKQRVAFLEKMMFEHLGAQPMI